MKQLPFSSNINNYALASIFNYTSATYKFYWFLGIIEEVESEKQRIPKENIFARMIANTWYPINYFKLSFGSQDKISEIISYFKNSFPLYDNSEKRDIYKLLTDDDQETRKQLFHLDKNVPHKFLSPWYKGAPKNIREKSQNDTRDVIYRLYKNEILINENWYRYIRSNSKILKDFVYWNLGNFVQARNPSTPNVLSKLIKPAKRNSLTKQRQKFWNIYLEQKPHTKCIFTNEVLDINNYHVDHFVPYSFVSHDLIWNLVPIDSNFNSSKNNKLPLKKHFERFYTIQNDVISFFGKTMPKNFKEEYLSIFPRFSENQNISFETYQDVINPLITVAHNNGFEYLE